MTRTSPFSLGRFEYEPVHLYYLPPKTFSALQDFKPIYLIGSRGTGKTTLLSALNWEEQLTNQSLKQELRACFAERKYVGIYLRAPRFQCDQFDTWLSGEDEPKRAVIFSTYFDLTWLEVAANALAELLARGVLSAPVSEEYLTTKAILDRFPQLLTDGSGLDACSFKQLSTMLRLRREKLEEMALWKLPIDQAFLTRHYPIHHLGEFGRIAGAHLGEFCDRNTPEQDNDERKWHFKVCLDEAEYLSGLQRWVVNSLVRLASVPVSYIIAYVRDPGDLSRVLLPKMSLQQADRDVFNLDSVGDSEFQELSEGVARVRVGYHLGRPIERFDTRAILGALDINGLLDGILSASENPRARELLARASALANTPFYEVDRGEGLVETASEATGVLPIYQAYIIDKLGLEIPSPGTPRWERRAQESAKIRKRMVAAYLCICADMKQAVRYASAHMVLQMSDKCVRDYLALMNEIFMEFGKPLEEFLTSSVPPLTQDRALKAASTKKRDFLPQSGISSPREAAALVDGVAELTAKLQAMFDSPAALKSSERGLFVVPRDVLGDAADLARLIAEAAEAGYLKIVLEGRRHRVFRIHCSLAAAYGFSHRGAYYRVRIGYEQLAGLVACSSDQKERLALAARLARTLDRGASAPSMPLFEA